MRLEATLRLPGEVELLDDGERPPADGAAVSGIRPGARLFIDGLDVGFLVASPDVSGDVVYTYGSEEPVDFVASETRLDAVLTLPGVCPECREAIAAVAIAHRGTCSRSAMRDPEHPFHDRKEVADAGDQHQ